MRGACIGRCRREFGRWFSPRLLAVALFLTLPFAVRGDIVGVTGAVLVADPPADISNGAWISRDAVRVWFERERTLDAPLNVNHAGAGTISEGSDQSPATLPTGAQVTSYMARFDPGQNNGITLTGSISFSADIVGVISTSGFGSTDAILGRPGVTYNTNNNRGLELGSTDGFAISADLRTISFTMFVLNQPTDDLRIITADSAGLAGACCSGSFCAFVASSACNGRFVGVGASCENAGQPVCCFADFNGSGAVTVQDIFTFLAAWFADDPSSDFNNTGGITVQDIFDYLTAYFTGCD